MLHSYVDVGTTSSRCRTAITRICGLLFLTNGAFPRHRHDLFVSHLCAALTCELDEHPDHVGSAWIRWLAPAP